MTNDKILEVMARYVDHLSRIGVDRSFWPRAAIDMWPCAAMPAADDDGTSQHVRDVIGLLRDLYRAGGIAPAFFGHQGKTTDETAILGHCSQMLDKMEAFLDEGRVDKALRWLGFILGCAYAVNLRPTQKDYILLAGCRCVCDETRRLALAGDRTTAFLGLGFVQGCLFSLGHFSIGELADHSRPAPGSE